MLKKLIAARESVAEKEYIKREIANYEAAISEASARIDGYRLTLDKHKLSLIGFEEVKYPEKVDIFRVENGYLVHDNFKVFFEELKLVLNIGKIEIEFTSSPRVNCGFHPFIKSHREFSRLCLGNASGVYEKNWVSGNYDRCFEILKTVLSYVDENATPYYRIKSYQTGQVYLNSLNKQKFPLCENCGWYSCQCPRCGFCGQRDCICDTTICCDNCHALVHDYACKKINKQGLLKLSKLRGVKYAESK